MLPALLSSRSFLQRVGQKRNCASLPCSRSGRTAASFRPFSSSRASPRSRGKPQRPIASNESSLPTTTRMAPYTLEVSSTPWTPTRGTRSGCPMTFGCPTCGTSAHGGGGSLTGFRQPETLLVWDGYTVHKTAACKQAMAKSNTTLFLLPGGLPRKFSFVTGL